MTLDEYEEGILVARVFIPRKWWQFWRPKQAVVSIGQYTMVGVTVRLELASGDMILFETEKWTRR